MFSRPLQSLTALSLLLTHIYASPCSEISAAVRSRLQFQQKSQNSDLGSILIDGQIAYDCLKSSTFHHHLGASYAREIKKYLEFQSTLAFLKDPPANYSYPPTDILDRWDRVIQSAETDSFLSEYDFEQTMLSVITSAHDTHLFQGDFCATSAAPFYRPIGLTFISFDGVALPDTYVTSDVVARNSIHSDFISPPSPVVAINGMNVNEFLEREALQHTYDPDAAWNCLQTNTDRYKDTFPTGRFAQPLHFWPGPWTMLTFANGTKASYRTQARIDLNTWSTDISDGESFTRAFCLAPTKTSPPTTSASSRNDFTIQTAPPSKRGFSSPWALVEDAEGGMSGHLPLWGKQAIAVLRVRSFAAGDPWTSATSFQKAVGDFFDLASLGGTEKIIIDLTGHGGGNIALAYDLFKRFFPHKDPYDAARLRLTPASAILGRALARDGTVCGDPTETLCEHYLPFDYRSGRNITDASRGFSSYEELYKPWEVHGDVFTQPWRPPFNDTDYDIATDLVIPYGYGGASTATNQRVTSWSDVSSPFATENILILTDGLCASSCATFVSFMKQAGVKTLLLGGRPTHGPAQAVGGTKGSQMFTFDALQNITRFAWETRGLIPASQRKQAQEVLPGLQDLPLGRPEQLGSFAINLRDALPRGSGEVPLQFVRENADCRLFYTRESQASPLALWHHAASVMWGRSECAWGSLRD